METKSQNQVNLDIHKYSLAIVLSRELSEHNLPRLKAIEDKLNHGETINEFDEVYLEHGLTEMLEFRPYLENDPSWRGLYASACHRYHVIIEQIFETY